MYCDIRSSVSRASSRGPGEDRDGVAGNVLGEQITVSVVDPCPAVCRDGELRTRFASGS